MGIVRELLFDESGQGMVEYALIIALIAIGVIVALGALGKSLYNSFDNTGKKIDANMNATP